MNPPEETPAPSPHKPGDEILEIPAVHDAELQAIDCVRQVLELFFPDAAAHAPERVRVLSYCMDRFAGGPPRFLRSRSFGPPPGVPPMIGSPFESLGIDPKQLMREARKANEELDREEIIPPDPDEKK